MACCNSRILFVINLLSYIHYAQGNSIITDTNNGYKPTQIDCDKHQNCLMCPTNKQCNVQCDAFNPCNHVGIFAEYVSLLVLNIDPLFVSDLTIYVPSNDKAQISIFKTDTNNNQQAVSLNDVMDMKIIRRHLLNDVVSTIHPQSSSKKSQSGLMKIINAVDPDRQYILYFIIGALVISICCVTCCCLYFYNRTQRASKRMKKLSIQKPSKVNIIKPPNHGLRSPTGNTVATYSSYGSNPTASPAGFSVQSDMSPYHIRPPNVRNKGYQSARSLSPQSPYNNYKMNHDCDNSLSVQVSQVSADETLNPRLQEQNTRRSMDVNNIQLSPNVSVQKSTETSRTNSTLSTNEYVGFVMKYNTTPTAQTWQQMQVPNIGGANDTRNMYPIRSHSSSVPFQNNSNNNTWNGSYPQRNTVSGMRPAAYAQNTHPQSMSPSPYAQNTHPYACNNNSNNLQNVQNNRNDSRFRFEPQYQYPTPPPKPQYNVKPMNPQMNTIDIPPPPLPKQNDITFESLQIVQDEQSELEMTHITASTLASLNTADFEDSNSDSVSSSNSTQSKKLDMERQDSDTTDGNTITCIKHVNQDTYATHTMCDSDVYDLHCKDLDSVVFSVPESKVKEVADVPDQVGDGTYMTLQRHLNLKSMDAQSMFALDVEPEHSPNNSMVTLDTIAIDGNVSVLSDDSHT
eukprot:51981_1